jgi:transcriptional regulator with XRE-family HTH domain
MQGHRRQIQPSDLKSRAIGAVVSEFRKTAGLSQEALSNRCGFERTYLSRVERGILNPTAIRLWKIADALEAPFHLMVGAMEAWVSRQKTVRHRD